MRWCSSKSIHRALGPALALAASEVTAHGFGQRYDLPLPLWLWLLGAGATLVLTFAAMAVFARGGRLPAPPQLDLLRFGALRWLLAPVLLGALRLAAVLVFLLTVAAGFIGNPNPYANIINTMVWVIWWVGFAFICALVGDLWALVNPLRTLFVWAERLAARVSGRGLSLNLAWPRWLGVWPAVLLLFAFAWAELVWCQKDVPAALARAVTGYAVLSWAGMVLFGRETWLARGEVFSILFGVLARFAPLAWVPPAAASERPRLVLRLPGSGLADGAAVHPSFAVFVLLMLASVTFDGFKEIALMQQLETAVHQSPTLALLLFELSEWGLDETQVVQTLVLLFFLLAFAGAFWLTSWLMLHLTRHTADAAAGLGTTQAACSFVLTLVPIAVAYHLSHYFSLLVTAGQFIIPLASDPFGWGWNLFGSAGYKVDLALLSPWVFWYSAVLIIVLGHVIAVVLSHVAALRLFGSERAALLSQVPMLVLMVGYTTLSLWILAQPIVGH